MKLLQEAAPEPYVRVLLLSATVKERIRLYECAHIVLEGGDGRIDGSLAG